MKSGAVTPDFFAIWFIKQKMIIIKKITANIWIDHYSIRYHLFYRVSAC